MISTYDIVAHGTSALQILLKQTSHILLPKFIDTGLSYPSSPVFLSIIWRLMFQLSGDANSNAYS